MINFRFHLVSLIAVFLALALGVVIGSTVIDRAIVDGLEAQIDRVERNADEQRRENGELRQRLEGIEVFADQVAPFAIDGQLAGVPVAVVAVRGVDEDAVHATVASLRSAGADAPVVLWLEPVWALPRQVDRGQLREIVAVQATTPANLRTRALEVLADRLAVPAEPEEAAAPTGDDGEPPAPTSAPTTSTTSSTTSSTTTTTVEGVPPEDAGGADPLVALVDAGFVSVDPAGGDETDLAAFPEPGARVVVVSGPAGRVSTETLYLPLLQALVDQPVPALAAEIPVADDEEGVAAALDAVRSERTLSELVPTVDGIDTIRGRVALVLALAHLGEGRIGHYGTGPGASRQLPELTAG